MIIPDHLTLEFGPGLRWQIGRSDAPASPRSDNKLPDMVLALHGPSYQPVEIDAVGRIDSVHGGIRTSATSAPDPALRRSAVPFPQIVRKRNSGSSEGRCLRFVERLFPSLTPLTPLHHLNGGPPLCLASVNAAVYPVSTGTVPRLRGAIGKGEIGLTHLHGLARPRRALAAAALAAALLLLAGAGAPVSGRLAGVPGATSSAAAAECNGDECQSVPPPPDDPTPGTATAEGPPNPPAHFGKHHRRKRPHRGKRHHGKRGRR